MEGYGDVVQQIGRCGRAKRARSTNAYSMQCNIMCIHTCRYYSCVYYVYMHVDVMCIHVDIVCIYM